MEKEAKLVKKLRGLFEKLNFPRFLHHFGPRKFELRHHLFSLILKEVTQMSFRRLQNVFGILGFKVPSYSALCKSRKRIPKWIWNKLLKITSKFDSSVAVDGTGFSRKNPSFHYIKRIDSKNPKASAKLSMLFGVGSKSILAINVRSKPRHDIKDVKPLLNKSPDGIKVFYGDAAYDAEWLYERCFEKGIQTQIKPRRGNKRGFFRRKQMKNYSDEEYHKRSVVEAGFGSLKRKYGSCVKAKKFKGLETEIYCKAIAHNLGLFS